MDPSQNFPPSPREMYMYRPAQQVNGHSVQSPSPSRGRPPPVLPERRPETQLSNRSSRSSMSSKGSFSSEVASPPQSPGFAAHRQHSQHSSQGSTRHSDNKPFSYAAAGSDVNDGNYKMDRDTSPHSRRGNIQYDGGAGFQRYAQHETDVSQQDSAVVYQRIDKSRDHLASASDNRMAGGQEYYHSGDFQESSSSRKSEGIYGQFVEPSNGSHHRPSLTFVPPPVVPPLQPDFWKEDKTPAGHQQPVEVSHQKQQPHLQPHKVKAPTPQAPPPPPPPLRNSSTSQLSAQHHSNLSSVPVGSRSPRSGSPARAPLSMSHPGAKQPTLATMDELAQVKLRSVGESSSPLQSPVAHTDTSGALNVRLRPTPGKFSKIYTEDEVTLPSPPDDLDELPPPPPPHELLNDDLSSMALQPPHGTPDEANSSQIDHRHPQLPLWQQQWCTPGCSSSQPEDSASSARGRSASSRSTRTAENSALDSQISGSVSSMDFEIPDDIDLSQCPGLVEITKHTPNWKRDMIEKKNQEKIEEYVKKILKEREQEAKWKNVPEWKKKILQKKEEEEGAVATGNIASDVKSPAGKKPAKKAPVPPPKEAKEDFTPPKPKGDIVPAALSIDPEELAAMPPWKRELLFKRDKVPVTFSNEFNPEDENANEDQPS